MKKIFWVRTVKLLALVIPVIIFILVVQSCFLFRIDYNTTRLRSFYEEPKNTLDVVFVGASDIYTGFSPAYAYSKYGFTSYNYALDAAPGSLYIPFLKEVLKHQNPKLIVIEVNGYLQNDTYLANEGPLLNFVESTPLSINKIETVMSYDIEDKINCLIPFVRYHGNWKKLQELRDCYVYTKTTAGKPSMLKGVATNNNIQLKEPTYDVRDDLVVKNLSDASYAALVELLDFCKSESLENVLFVRFPHRLSTESSYTSYQRSNMVDQVVSKYGYRFLNLERSVEEIGLDYAYDFYNDDHLAIHGQIKLTDYLSTLIREQYVTSPIIQTTENKIQWDCAAKYAIQFNNYMQWMRTQNDRDLRWETPELIEILTQMIQDDIS